MFASYSILACFLILFSPGVLGVTCTSCHDQIPGCAGGAACPLYTTVAANVQIFVGAVAGALSIVHLLPLKFIRCLSKGYLDAMKILGQNTAPGAAINWGGLSITEVAQHPYRGLASPEDSIMELQHRLGAAGTELEAVQINGFIASLQSFDSNKNKKAGKATTGKYTFTLGQANRIVSSYASMSNVALEVEGEASSSSDSSRRLSTVLVHPTSQVHFLFGVQAWCMMLAACGAENYLTVSKFVVEHVYEHLSVRHWEWQVVYFYFLIILEKIECLGDPDINLSTISRMGGLDSFKEEALLRAEGHYGKGIFRSKREPPERPEGAKYNGKFTSSSNTLCAAFNRGPHGTHRANCLLPDGTCKFKHACNKWVTNKGPKGQCGSLAHDATTCDNPNRCDEAVV